MIPKKQDVRLILDNIRSVHNVGSIFRTAETVGVNKIYCIGTTPIPLDRFGQARKDFAKVSLGAENLVDWEYVKSATTLIKKLRKDGYYIVSIEQAEDSVNYRKVKIKAKAGIILGNEVDGVSRSILKLSHVIAEIPLCGKKESLNVSVAAGIVLYSLLNL
ncbi:MAG: TrmH family RNA methyltransferase [Candidatus Paceibacterota bacterium]|jgi:tRNA G18 (ribose-2'-O)-methylase SpoU